jgi:hypothetical protein
MQRYTKINNIIISIWMILFLIFSPSCKKMISIPEPTNILTTTQIFSTDDQATSVVNGIYATMANGTSLGFGNGAITIYTGMSADELINFSQVNTANIQFQENVLQSSNNIIYSLLWSNPYALIYSSNAAIEALPLSSDVHDSVKNELIGEAKFIRSFCYFYLVNLYGEVPLITSTNWQNTNFLKRSPISDIYNLIESDLKDAQARLKADFSAGNGERIIPNKFAALALLARVYLYKGDWTNAKIYSTQIISNPNFNLVPKLNEVFAINSEEAIWQLKQDNSKYSFNATTEGYKILTTNSPFVYLTKQLIDSFENEDQRRIAWIDTATYNGISYYYPYKYKIGAGQATPDGQYSEYYMVLRLAEQYLIRAEAESKLEEQSSAIIDLNMIRTRAGLSIYPGSQDQSSVLNAIYQERKVELFCEWGHRWLDLKRTNHASAILSPIKPKWSDYAQLYPIPQQELKTDPNLTQNPSY